MLSKIKKAISSDLVKVFSLNAVSTFIRMLTGFVSVKVVAVLVGPVGIALLGQLNNFSSILLSLSTGGINAGMTKYVAQYSDSEKRYSLFLRTGFWITAALSLLCGLVMMIGSAYFSQRILKDVQYKSVFIIFGATIILYAFNTMLVAVINGFREFKKYVTVNIAGSLVGLTFSIILAYGFGIYGALIAAISYQSVVFVITFILVVRSRWFKWEIFIGKFSRLAAVRLWQYSLMALITAVVVPISQLLVRSYINERTASMTDAGLWEGMNRISSMYLMVITTSLSIYYLPKLAQLKTKEEIRNEIFHMYKLVVPFLIILSLCIFVSRHIIIHILFNNKFAGMENLFAFQLVGDFFKITSWILAYQLIARAMTRLFIITEVLSSALFVLLSIFFVDLYGNVGATIGYAVNYFLYLVAMVFIFRKTIFNYERKPMG
jgi:O-antigen/teichoic acid export membrane protein